MCVCVCVCSYIYECVYVCVCVCVCMYELIDTNRLRHYIQAMSYRLRNTCIKTD